MDRKNASTVLLVVSVALVLVTAYLAIFYAPFPQTSVKSAGSVLESISGHRIQVAGFVSSIIVRQSQSALDLPQKVTFCLADFRDYERYKTAAADGHLDGQWWTVRPVDVYSQSDGLVAGSNPGVSGAVQIGVNLSVMANVVAEKIGRNSNVTGFSLKSLNGHDFTFGSSPGQFGIMSAPVAQKIFYFHMPSAWASYLAFFVTLLGGALYLKTRDQKYDRMAFSSAEIGIVFATLAILTGPVWAKQEWGVYWRWNDTKLVTTFILWLVYIGYLSLRAAVSEPSTKARVSAVYGILGFVMVPLSFLSARVAPLLQSSHPEVIATKSGSLSPEAGMTIGIAVAAFTAVFITMLIKRIEIAEAEDELEEIKRRIGEEE